MTKPTPPRRTRQEMAKYVIYSINELGISINPNSRLMQMYKALTDSDRIIQFDDPHFVTALEAQRDLQVFSFIFDQFKNSDSLKFKTILKKAFGDSILPQNDFDNSPGRDLQFELYIASVCKNAGFMPVEFEEPDILCSLNNEKYSIAAKRIKNTSRLEKHIKKATKQITQRGLSGIIAIDIAFALNPGNKCFYVPLNDTDYFKAVKSVSIDPLLRKYEMRIKKWLANDLVLGIMFHFHQIRMDTDKEWGVSSMTYWFNTNDNKKNEFLLFTNQYDTGLPNYI